MSDDRIYVRFKGKTLGPLSVQRAHELVRRGQITRMHDLSSDGISWMKAEEFGTLFPASRMPEPGVHDAISDVVSPTPKVEPDFKVFEKSEPRPPAVPERPVEWYAHIDGENRGPMSIILVQRAIACGEITTETLVWRPGYDDWQRAEESLPEPLIRQLTHDLERHGITEGNGRRGHRDDLHDLFDATQQQRPWAIFLASITLCFGILNALYCIVIMVVGAASPLVGSTKFIVGLTGLTLSILIIIGGWLFFRYAGTLKYVSIHRDQETLVKTARRLHGLFRYVGIAFLVTLGMMLALAIVAMLVMAIAKEPELINV